MDDSEKVKLDHQRNKSEIVNLVKEMFRLDKWGDEQFRVELLDLVTKDEKQDTTPNNPKTVCDDDVRFLCLLCGHQR